MLPAVPLSEIKDWLQSLPESERAAVEAEIEAAIAADMAETLWRPLVDVENPERPTPQRMAFESAADVLLYGGSAGGGKTDLLCGVAVTEHTRSIIFRREYRQLSAVVDRIHQIRRTRKGYSSHPEHRWLLGEERVIRLGGVQHVGDEIAYQGQPHDLYGFDELPQFAESQFRYLITWNRSTKDGQRCRVICTANPPDTDEGEWIIKYWAPWLDDNHPNPAVPGELRWFNSNADGEDTEVDGPEPVEIDGESYEPRSRTFIPSSVEDNPFLMASGYRATLQALPEPLRSQMLRGDFTAGRSDNPWQVIPSDWVRAAQDRWKPDRPKGAKMTTMGVDVAQGGDDKTVLMPRFGDWFDEPKVWPGKETGDSRITAGHVVAHLRDGAPAMIDVIGPGGEVYGHLDGQGVNVVAMDGSKPSPASDANTGRLRFVNKRAEWYWRMREALDPHAEFPIALPPDQSLRADLCAARWKLTPRGIQVEAKEDIISRLGRSPDLGDAAVYALADPPISRRAGSKRRKRGEGIVVEGIESYVPQNH